METKKTTIHVDIDLHHISYEEDVAQTIKEEILLQIRGEVRKHCRAIRDAVAAELLKEREQLIKQAISQISKLNLNE